MANTPESVLANLKKGNYAPVYLLHGEEAFYIDQIADYIENNILDEASKSFNQTVLYGKDSSISQIISQARRFPMMSPNQVVIVKEMQSLTDLTNEESQKLFIQYLSNPTKETILVLCHKNKTIDKRTQLGKTLDKLSISVSSAKIKDYKVPQWIQDYAKSRNVEITPDALRLLAEYIGNDLSRLANEINKILVNRIEGNKINASLVQRFVGISKDFNVFELQKSIAVGDMQKIYVILNYFGANPKSNPAVLTVGLLFSFFSKLLIGSKLNVNDRNLLAKEIGVPPFFVDDYQKALRYFNFNSLVQIITLLRQADGKVKGVDTGSRSPEQVVNELIYKIMDLRSI